MFATELRKLFPTFARRNDKNEKICVKNIIITKRSAALASTIIIMKKKDSVESC